MGEAATLRDFGLCPDNKTPGAPYLVLLRDVGYHRANPLALS
jgi:hypothetical protein